MRAPGIARAAATVLAVEGAALLAVALIEIFGLGGAAELPTAIALIVLTVLGAAALFGFAVGVVRGRSFARSGGIVVQVLGIVLAIAALTLDPIAWAFVLGVGFPGLVGFALLILSARSEGAVRDE